MKSSAKACLALRKLFWNCESWFRLRRFLCFERLFHQRIAIQSGTRFYTPTRGGGLGTLEIGCSNTFGYPSAPRMGSGEILIQARHPRAVIEIGNRNAFSNNISIIANQRITIGNGCQVGDQVIILDSDFHEISSATRNRSCGPTCPVSIGNNVWLGSRVMILKGVNIGDNTVVGAMSLVTGCLPGNCVAAGVPAKVIRSLE